MAVLMACRARPSLSRMLCWQQPFHFPQHGILGTLLSSVHPPSLFRFTFGFSITFGDSISTLPYCLCLILWTLFLHILPGYGFYGVVKTLPSAWVCRQWWRFLCVTPVGDQITVFISGRWWARYCIPIASVSLIVFAYYRSHIANERLFKTGQVLSLYIWGPGIKMTTVFR
jgi:hypothetical protein